MADDVTPINPAQTFTADVASLNATVTRLQDALHRVTVGLSRQDAALNERVTVLENGAIRDPSHREHVAAAKVERDQQLVPRSRQDQQPAPKVATTPAKVGAPVAVPKTKAEIAAHITLLESHKAALQKQADNDKLPQTVRDNATKNIGLLDRSIARWRKVKPSDDPPTDPPTDRTTADPPADPVDDKPAEGAPFTAAEKAVANADHAQRMKMPAGWFLQSEARKYPVRDDKGNLSQALLTHAAERASQSGNEKVAAEARKLLKAHFPDKKPEPSKPSTTTPARARRWI